MKRVFKWMGGAVAAVLAVGAHSVVIEGKPPRKVTVQDWAYDTGAPLAGDAEAGAQQARPVSAAQLTHDYDANEVSADRRYKGRLLSVSGIVQGVDKDGLGHIIVRLRTANEYMPVLAYLDGAHEALAAALKKGARVTWNCTGDGSVVGSPVLRRCVPVTGELRS